MLIDKEKEIEKQLRQHNLTETIEYINDLKDYIKKCESGEAYWVKSLLDRPKETAKEILQDILGFVGSKQKFCIVNAEHKILVDVNELFYFLTELANKYNIKVEQ